MKLCKTVLLFQVKTENIKMSLAEEAIRQFYPQTASQKIPFSGDR